MTYVVAKEKKNVYWQKNSRLVMCLLFGYQWVFYLFIFFARKFLFLFIYIIRCLSLITACNPFLRIEITLAVFAHKAD